jgi:hypothetical protein
MRKKLSFLFALIGWFAVITQFCLMMQNRVAPIPETTLRFFSFFTITTNIMVAIYFTMQLFGNTNGVLNKPGTLTAITVYITVVGLIYQFALRHVWHPKGLQMVVDELLHSIIPILVIIYWYLYEEKREIKYIRALKWLIYPAIYLVFIMDRGYFTGFYPYPFVNVNELGVGKTALHCGYMLLLFIALALLYIRIGKAIDKK